MSGKTSKFGFMIQDNLKEFLKKTAHENYISQGKLLNVLIEAFKSGWVKQKDRKEIVDGIINKK